MPTALIVDDDAAIRGVVRLGAASLGIEVVGEASTATHAFEVARMTHPDIIVLDAVAAASGEKVAELLRTVAPDTTIICLSGAFETKPDWADDFVSKNDIDKLFDLLRGLVNA